MARLWKIAALCHVLFLTYQLSIGKWACNFSVCSSVACSRLSPTQPDPSGSPCHFMQGNTRFAVASGTYFNPSICGQDFDYGNICSKADSCVANFKADIIFAMDTSKCLEWKKFEKELELIKKLCNDFQLGPDNVLVTVKIFTDHELISLPLSQSHDRDVLLKNMFRLDSGYRHNYPSGSYKLIQQLKELEVLTQGRQGTKKIIVLIADQDITIDDSLLIYNIFNTLRYKDINIISVATSWVNRTILEDFSGNPANVITAQSFDEPSLHSQVRQLICAVPNKR